MSAKIANLQRTAEPDTEADIDRFLAERHHEIAAKLAAGREQVAGGDVAPLEPLDQLLRDARAAR